MSEFIANVGAADFAGNVTERKGLVLVDFWAPWCGPCRTIAPIVEELAKDYGDDLHVIKVDADENKPLLEEMAVRGIPTLILFSDGVEMERVVGATGKTRLAEIIDKHLEGGQ